MSSLMPRVRPIFPSDSRHETAASDVGLNSMYFDFVRYRRRQVKATLRMPQVIAYESVAVKPEVFVAIVLQVGRQPPVVR